MKKAYVVFENGDFIEGESFGFVGERCGELVFTTGMTGYEQSLTDPSFAGQILTFTYPLLGNYGIPRPITQAPHVFSNFESERIWAAGVVVSVVSRFPSHYRAKTDLSSWLAGWRVPGIAGVDTRALTQMIRERGTMRAVLSSQKRFFWDESVVTNPVSRVSIPRPLEYNKHKTGKKIILIDCGVKHGILRALLARGYRVLRIPWNEDPRPYIAQADGVVCSNGPGDPKECTVTIEHIRHVISKRIPFLGICLGHQLAALAIGADTYKLPYGHRGLNQPCEDVISGRAYVTSQNHGYAVKKESIPQSVREWFINCNDQTNEGMRGIEHKLWTTQFHPEGNPGPFDTDWVFDVFNI